MHLIYTVFIYTYSFAIRIASLFNSKAKLWIEGRKNIFERLRSEFQNPTSGIRTSGTIWVHCASLGEFEQGRPLIEKLREKEPGVKIILTFFSPSGFEIRENYKGADHVFYLPADTRKNAKLFLDIVKPKAVFFIKYEFWFNYLNELKKNKIPTYLVSGIFRNDHYFFRAYGSWFRKQLSCFTHFFVQDENSKELLNSVGHKNVSVFGDTRFDRVSEIIKNKKNFPLIQLFKNNSELLVAGSTWPEDETLILEWAKLSGLLNKDITIANANFKLIIVPHEIGENHIQSIVNKFKDFSVLRYSKVNDQNIKNANILIIDNIGMLSSLYNYGTIAFIGGGFGKGIHNILEPAATGLPVIFGPEYQKFTEAKELIKAGGAFSVADLNGMNKIISNLEDKDFLKTASHISKSYVESKVGATDKILNFISLK